MGKRTKKETLNEKGGLAFHREIKYTCIITNNTENVKKTRVLRHLWEHSKYIKVMTYQKR